MARTPLSTSASITFCAEAAGVATMPEDADTVEQLIAAADEALYTAKRLGRNRVVTTKNRASRPAW